MISALEKAMNKKCFSCIHINQDNTQKFVFGRIIGVNLKNIAISMVSPIGEYDGILIRETDDVFLVEFDTIYEEKMKKLMSSHGYKDKIISPNNDFIIWGLQYAKDNDLPVSVELCHSGYDDVVGLVLQLDNSLCMIAQIDDCGNNDGKASFRVNEITQLSIDSRDERIRYELNRTACGTGDGSVQRSQ